MEFDSGVRNYFISTEIYPQRWQWWKIVFSRSQSATRTMKFHWWKIIVRGVWLDDRCFFTNEKWSYSKPRHPWRENWQAALLFLRCRKGLWTSVQLTRKQSHIKKTRDVKLLQILLGSRNELRKVEEIQALELNECICEFIISVRTKDRKDYEPSSLPSLLASFCLIAVNCHFCLKEISVPKLFRIRKLTRSLRPLVRFLILLNSWIKIVRAHFRWSNLYLKWIPTS